MNWRDRVALALENTPGSEPTKPTEPPFVGSVSAAQGPFGASGATAEPGRPRPEPFDFAPPGDSESDAEALAERAAIMAEANGWDDTRALQEARWQAERERAWRAFLRNAQRVLDAPLRRRGALLSAYEREAAQRYGQAIGSSMAATLRQWVNARQGRGPLLEPAAPKAPRSARPLGPP